MIDKALLSLCPSASFVIEDDTYESIIWHPDNIDPLPSKEDVELAMIRLKDEDKKNEYQRLRAAEYPSFADQFDLLYHSGYDVWKQTIQAVKDKYPKP